MKKQSLWNSFQNALKGIKKMLKTERNFQIHIIGLFINIILIFLLKLSFIEIILSLEVSFLVLAVEMLNTVIEKLCNYVQPNFDPRIGEIKDISAGAVLMVTILAIIVGIGIYGKHLLKIAV